MNSQSQLQYNHRHYHVYYREGMSLA